VHKQQLSVVPCGCDKSHHALLKGDKEEIGWYDQSVMMGDVIADHNECDILSEPITDHTQGLLLVLQELIHESLEQRQASLIAVRGAHYARGPQGSVKEGSEAGDDAHSRALRCTQVALKVAYLGC
jgi:hypothetical protein